MPPPTFIETENRMGIIGTPGGSRIITMVTLGALAFQQGKTAEEIVNLPRFHHQYLPDQIQFETDAFDSKLQESLKKMGHTLEEKISQWGNMHIVILDKASGKVTAASDKRGIGSAITKP